MAWSCRCRLRGWISQFGAVLVLAGRSGRQPRSAGARRCAQGVRLLHILLSRVDQATRLRPRFDSGSRPPTASLCCRGDPEDLGDQQQGRRVRDRLHVQKYDGAAKTYKRAWTPMTASSTWSRSRWSRPGARARRPHEVPRRPPGNRLPARQIRRAGRQRWQPVAMKWRS